MHVLIELETTHKRRQQRKTNPIELTEEENNFQEVGSSTKKLRRKTTTNSNKAINVTCNNNNEPNELTDDNVYTTSNNNNVRVDVEAAQNVAYANLANQHNKVKTEHQNKLLKNNNLEDNHHHQQQHNHSSFWSSNSSHHFNQLGVDLLHRPQQHQPYQQQHYQQQQQLAKCQERDPSAQHNLTWFQKGASNGGEEEREEEEEQQKEEDEESIDQLSAGGLSRADNFAQHTQHYQSGHFHNKLTGYNTADYQLLSGGVVRAQNASSSAGGRRGGAAAAAEAEAADASELEVEELAAAPDLKPATSLTGLDSKQANATENANNEYNQLR